MHGWVVVGVAVVVGCNGGGPPDASDPSDGTTLPPTGSTGSTPTELPGTWRWEPIAVEGVVPRWGTTSAGNLVVGGIDDALDVTTDVVATDASTGTLTGEVVGALGLPRFCACTLYDTDRNELLVVGGRDTTFADAASAEVVSLDTGESTPIEVGEGDDHPIGCMAFTAAGVGYVFGGAGGMSLDGRTWRYDADARTLELLDIVGPGARYDGGIEPLPNGDVLLLGGMEFPSGGDTGMRSDVWRFVAADEAWVEVEVGADAPEGRRFPWTALSADGGRLVYGYGSDSAVGATVLRDLWSLDLTDGTWTRLDFEGGDRPRARAFTVRYPGPPGSEGVLAFGVDETLTVFDDAWVLWGP